MKKNLLKSTQFAFFYLSILLSSTFFIACDTKDDVIPIEPQRGKYASGILIANEGPFQNGSGSITFYDPVAGTVEQNAFERANNRVLGNIVQSVNVYENSIYTVVNNAGKVEVASDDSFVSTGVIEGLALPRYFLGITPQKAYITEWGANGVEGNVQVVDLRTNQVIKTIPVGSGAERMLLVGNEVYVACKGGFGSDNRVFVIDTRNDSVVKEIEVGANPNSLQLDAQGNIWVLCGGQFRSDFTGLVSSSELYKIDPNSRSVTGQFPFNDFNNTASDLVINERGDTLYFLKGGSVFAVGISLGEQITIDTILQGFYYGLGYNPVDGLLFVSDANDFASNGSVFIVDPVAGIIDEIPAGIIPNGGFYFSMD